jgi:hypothetical protein
MEKEPSKCNQNCSHSQWSAIGIDENTNYDDIQVVEMTDHFPQNEMQINNCDPEATEETAFLETISIGKKTDRQIHILICDTNQALTYLKKIEQTKLLKIEQKCFSKMSLG